MVGVIRSSQSASDTDSSLDEHIDLGLQMAINNSSRMFPCIDCQQNSTSDYENTTVTVATEDDGSPAAGSDDAPLLGE